MRKPYPPASAFRQRGTTLVEALIAFGVLTLGLLGVAQMHSSFRLHADIIRQRVEAMRVASQELEAMRAFAVRAASAPLRSYADVRSASAHADSSTGLTTNTRYAIDRRVAEASVPNAREVEVEVRWLDRTGSAHQAVFASLVHGAEPALSTALTLPAPPSGVRGAHGRAPSVPLAAKDLGDGRSAFKPVAGGSMAYVLDNATGVVTQRCASVGSTLSTDLLSTANLGTCEAIRGLLVSGTVRFTSSVPPDADPGGETPLRSRVEVEVESASGSRPQACESEAMKTVLARTAGVSRLQDVPLDAAPPPSSSWTDTGARFVSYHCVVIPSAGDGWSGRVAIVPLDWTVGRASGEHRVCRHVVDLDGSGAIDTNLEHPAHYIQVNAALTNLNFLVIRGEAQCPRAPADRAAAASNTEQHQP